MASAPVFLFIVISSPGDQCSILAIVLTLCTWMRDFVFSHSAYVLSTYDAPAVKLRRVVINFVTLSQSSSLSCWSGFQLSVKSIQTITLALVLVLVLVLVLPRF